MRVERIRADRSGCSLRSPPAAAFEVIC